MSNKEDLIQQTAKYVQSFFLDNSPGIHLFHNYNHTKEVVASAQKIAAEAGLSTQEKQQLLLAAWFHLAGYATNSENPRQESAALARQFLTVQSFDEEEIDIVENIILSTAQQHTPNTLAEKILHDARHAFLGRKRFFRKSRLLRMEYEATGNTKHTLLEWNEHLLGLLVNTKYYTPWAQNFYGARKARNISTQQQNIVKASEKTIRNKTGKNFGRGIDTLYRITLRNHLNLSSIADGKASMIISINTLVLSILITAGTAGLSITDSSWNANYQLLAPIILLMCSSLLAIIFAVLSAIPKVKGLTFKMEDVKQHRVSLLFFGNFLQVEKEVFVEHLKGLKKDQSLLYDDLARDLYNLGVVLNKKYTLLTIAYRIFVGGLIVAVLLFLLIYFFAM
jgi:predicted metal-dependent HD superfamily phosphohydrolase